MKDRWLSVASTLVLAIALPAPSAAASLDGTWPAEPSALHRYSAAAPAEAPAAAAASPQLSPALAVTATVGLSWLPFGVGAGYWYAGEPGRILPAGLLQYGAMLGGGLFGGAVGLGVATSGAGRWLLPPEERPAGRLDLATTQGIVVACAATCLVVANLAYIIWSGIDVYRLAEQKNAAAAPQPSPAP